jgi:tetratricopeptide (TPR) repeat protein
MLHYSLTLALLLTVSGKIFLQPRQTIWLWPSAQQSSSRGTVSKNLSQGASFDDLREKGFSALYNLDYKTARDNFDAMRKLNPQHPAAYFYLAANTWIETLYSTRRLQSALYNEDSFYAPGEDKVDQKSDQQFHDWINKAIFAARERVKNSQRDVEALYYLGATYGLRAGYEASVERSFLRAARDGRRAVGYHKEVISLDKNYADAYLSIGLYDYVVGTLPWSIKSILEIFGVRGSRTDGLKELQTAVAKGRYANDDAAVILIAIYRREKNYGEALKLLEGLVPKYPQNYLFSVERAELLGRMGRSNEAYAIFEQVLKIEPPEVDLVHYQYGQLLFDRAEFARAGEQFGAVTKTQGASPALISLALLRRGQAYDALGLHDEAIKQYQAVLDRPNVFDSQIQATRYKKKPYTPENK